MIVKIMMIPEMIPIIELKFPIFTHSRATQNDKYFGIFIFKIGERNLKCLCLQTKNTNYNCIKEEKSIIILIMLVKKYIIMI